MKIRLDVFADMLKVRPSVLRNALHAGGVLDGISLPESSQIRGAAEMFDYKEVMAFLDLWKARIRTTPPSSDQALVSLNDLAAQATLPPLEIYQAVITGRMVKGVRLPVPVKKSGTLMFEPGDVDEFVANLRSNCSY